MSYILEALKKSDREYRLQQAADIDRLHLAAADSLSSRSSRVWFIVLPLLLLSAASLGYVLWSGTLWPFGHSATAAIAAEPADAGGGGGGGGGVSDAPSPQLTPGTGDPVPLHSMPPQLRSRVGPLQFSLHVYSPQAGQRSIIINNRMMREGEWLDAGLQLREITESGVILAIEGQRYRVPVVSDWQQ